MSPKIKIREETIVLDTTRPRESTKKLRFDPVNIWRCDDFHTITSGGRFFFEAFSGKSKYSRKPVEPIELVRTYQYESPQGKLTNPNLKPFHFKNVKK